MKKIYFIAALALMVAGCGQTRFSGTEAVQDYQQGRMDKSVIVCRDHVEYLSFPNSYGGSFTAHLQVDGKPYTC